MSDLRGRGAYTAERASALAGVPLSTLYEWARNNVIVPTVSAEKIKIWSWTDLVAARAVYWLRHPSSASRRATPMPQIRELLEWLASDDMVLGESLSDETIRLSASGSGTPFISRGKRVVEGSHQFLQSVAREFSVDLLEPFTAIPNAKGPHLIHPRPNIDIVPGKLCGEPHVRGTRIESRVLYALSQRGYTSSELAELYPDAGASAIRDALTLERSLQRNSKLLAA